MNLTLEQVAARRRRGDVQQPQQMVTAPTSALETRVGASGGTLGRLLPPAQMIPLSQMPPPVGAAGQGSAELGLAAAPTATPTQEDQDVAAAYAVLAARGRAPQTPEEQQRLEQAIAFRRRFRESGMGAEPTAPVRQPELAGRGGLATAVTEIGRIPERGFQAAQAVNEPVYQLARLLAAGTIAYLDPNASIPVPGQPGLSVQGQRYNEELARFRQANPGRNPTIPEFTTIVSDATQAPQLVHGALETLINSALPPFGVIPVERAALVGARAAVSGARRVAAEALVRAPQRSIQEAGLRLAGFSGAIPQGAAFRRISASSADLNTLNGIDAEISRLQRIGPTLGKRASAEVGADVEALQSYRESFMQSQLGTDDFARYQDVQRELYQAESSLAALSEPGIPAPRFGTTERSEFEAARRAREEAGQRVVPKTSRVAAEREHVQQLRNELNELENKASPELQAAPSTSGQLGMGIGEQPAQGQLLQETLGRGERIPLADTEQLAARNAQRAEIARGQTELPVPEPPPIRGVPEAPTPLPGRAVEAAAPPLKQVPSAAAVPVAPSAVTPALPPAGAKQARLRMSIKGDGFLIAGQDTKGRQVRVSVTTLDEAKQARANIEQGLEALPGTEADAYYRQLGRAERGYRAALRKGEVGPVERAKVRLEKVQASAPPDLPPPPTPPAPPNLPPTVGPGGTLTPPPDFNAARDHLVRIVRGAAKRGREELEQLRTAERARRHAIGLRGTEEALAAGESPLPMVRGSQRGALPAPELQLADRLSTDEVRVLRDRIYKTLGPELNETAANIEESLNRLAMEGKIPTPSQMQWMEEIFGPELVDALLTHEAKGAKALRSLLAAWNLPRALIASFDDSMVLRQGMHLLPEGAPAARALRSHVKALTEAGAEAINEAIRSDPLFNHARAHGLSFTLPSRAAGLGGHEEVFRGADLASKIPIIGKGVQISERIASAYLNKLRMETYAAHAEELFRMNAGFEAFKELANNINVLSGRASLGRLSNTAIESLLNGIFFSARLNWAAAQRPFLILRQVPKLGTPEGRSLARMLARDVYGLWAGIGGMLGLAAASGFAAVELDPRSSDFGKLQINTVRVDPWAGQEQWAVLMARIVTGQVRTTTTRQLRPAVETEVLGRFIESKFHPALGQLLAVKRGKTYVGQELTVNEYAKQWLPLFIQDVQDISAGTTPGMAAALGVASLLGVSLYNIPGVPATVINTLVHHVDAYNAIPTDAAERQPGQQTRTAYRDSHPDADAALFITAQTTGLLTAGAIANVVRIVQENGLDPDNIRGVAERKTERQRAADNGVFLPWNNVDALIHLLETAPASGNRQGPAQSQTEAVPSSQNGQLMDIIRKRRQEREAVGTR